MRKEIQLLSFLFCTLGLSAATAAAQAVAPQVGIPASQKAVSAPAPLAPQSPAQTASPAPTQTSAQALAQAPAQTQSTPTLQVSPLKALQEFEPAEGAEYELGPGDELTLNFPGRPELSGKVIVGPDGRITIPIAGSIKVSDLTRTQAEKAIIAALAPYYTDASVTISIDKYGANRIIVIGNVQHPGVFYFDGTPTLLDAIARGGLLASSGAGAGGATSMGAAQDGIPERCAIYRGNDQVVWVNLKSLLQSGNSLADLRLKRNDIVFIPAQQEVFVSVMGDVMHPGAVALTSQSTLVSVLAQAGGVGEGSGKNIQIVQPSTGKTITVSYKSLLTPSGTNEVQLHSGDVVYVPKSGFYNATYVMQRLAPMADIGMVGVFAAAAMP